MGNLKNDILDSEDVLSQNLKKAVGITAILNASTSSQAEVLPQDVEWATWALEDLLRAALASHQQLAAKDMEQLRAVANL